MVFSTSEGHIRTVEVANTSNFASFGALQSIEAGALSGHRPRWRSHLDHLCNQREESTEGRSRNALTALATLGRRAARETISLCHEVDKLARVMAEDLRLGGAKGIEFHLQTAAIDRPSLRVLARLRSIAPAGVSVRLIAHIHERLDGDPVSSRLVRQTSGCFDEFRNAGTSRWKLQSGSLARKGSVVRRMERALEDHNYEMLFLYADAGLKRQTASDVHFLRAKALAEAMCGDITGCRSTLRTARKFAPTRLEEARVDYLEGLVVAKRMPDPRLAEHLLLNARNAFAQSECPAKTRQLELSWVRNALALVAVLEARSLHGLSRQEALDGISQEVMAILDETIRYNGPEFVYLHHNLIANLTFLEEIKGNYARAATIWQRTFERWARYSLDEDSNMGRTAIFYYYRLACLKLLAGDCKAAVAAAAEAASLVSASAMQLLEDRVLLLQAAAQLAFGKRRSGERLLFQAATRAREEGNPEASRLIKEAISFLEEGSVSPSRAPDIASRMLSRRLIATKLPTSLPHIDLDDGKPGVHHALALGDASAR